ncbi:MAG TPA: MarR family transcriptional regulator [Solirubrobacterales bacterium]
MRRRLLVALGEGAATPSDLARVVGARKESVSRKLTELRDEGLVSVAKDADDRRRSPYSLTSAGRSELGRHLTFGSPEKAPPPPGEAEEAEFLREALVGAVAMRRRSNRLQDAIDRFEEIRAQAEEVGDSELALEALAELATTQRQDRQYKERKNSLEVLRRMASGTDDVEPKLVYPAIAHLEYERGKAGDLGDTDTAALGRHLMAATSLFEALIDERPQGDTRSWRNRRAWSVVSYSNNLREQSRYEEALRYAASGLRMFEELEDDYGRTQCWFLFGFCLRLLRQFEVAYNCLEHAYSLAVGRDNSFERAMAYCLVQMGEVRRCQGKTKEAHELLGSAFEHAERLELHVAKAFATSGIAATEFQENHLDRAQVTLRDAQGIFDRCDHREGIALNARRQATVARHLSAAEIPPDEPEVKALIKRAEETYFSLGSPAGVAACWIERGWMRKYSPECGDLDEVVDRLIRMLGKDDERETLELDPWVPKVLREFSKEIGGQLEKEAKQVLTNARHHLEKKGEQGVQRVSEATGDPEEARESRPSTPVVEMGGESRRKKAPLELVAA